MLESTRYMDLGSHVPGPFCLLAAGTPQICLLSALVFSIHILWTGEAAQSTGALLPALTLSAWSVQKALNSCASSLAFGACIGMARMESVRAFQVRDMGKPAGRLGGSWHNMYPLYVGMGNPRQNMSRSAHTPPNLCNTCMEMMSFTICTGTLRAMRSRASSLGSTVPASISTTPGRHGHSQGSSG